MITSFTLEEAQQFQSALQRYKELYRHEWSSVSTRWNDLTYTWDDSYSRGFEAEFQKIFDNYEFLFTQVDRHFASVEQQIQVVERLNSTITHCDSISTRNTIQKVQSIKSIPNQSGNIVSTFNLEEKDFQDWVGITNDLSKTITQSLKKICAGAAISSNLFFCIIGSPAITQVIQVGRTWAKIGITVIAQEQVPNLLDLNSKTFGAVWSNLPDSSPPKIMASIVDEHEEYIFGNEAAAELAGQLKDTTEAERKRREEEAKIAAIARSQSSQHTSST